jgi:hypothetical protein
MGYTVAAWLTAGFTDSHWQHVTFELWSFFYRLRLSSLPWQPMTAITKMLQLCGVYSGDLAFD